MLVNTRLSVCTKPTNHWSNVFLIFTALVPSAMTPKFPTFGTNKGLSYPCYQTASRVTIVLVVGFFFPL